MEKLSEKELEAVLSLNAEYRQAFFNNKSKENQGLFIILQEEGPFMLEDENEEVGDKYYILPVFPYEELAQAYVSSTGVNAKVQFITSKAWNESWVNMLVENKVMLGFIPVSDQDFAVDDPKNI